MDSSRRGAPGGAKSATACITSLHIVGENNLADFNSAVSTPTAKPPNLILRQNFRLYTTLYFMLHLTILPIICTTSSAFFVHYYVCDLCTRLLSGSVPGVVVPCQVSLSGCQRSQYRKKKDKQL